MKIAIHFKIVFLQPGSARILEVGKGTHGGKVSAVLTNWVSFLEYRSDDLGYRGRVKRMTLEVLHFMGLMIVPSHMSSVK